MKRRHFLIGSGTAATAFFTARWLSAREWLHNTWELLGGTSTVKNAKAIPAFKPFTLKHDAGVRFLVMGDWGTGAEGQSKVAKSMAATAKQYGCDYIISTGDNIYPKGVQSANDEQWKRKFTAMYYASGLHMPVYPTLGNHDYGFDPDAQIAYSRTNPQWRFPSRYYVEQLKAPDGTTVDIFSLDTQLVQTGVAGAAEEQSTWLDTELGRSKARWKIVFGHHMLYSNGAYGNLKRMRQAFESVLVRHKVPLYMCGHDHDIQLLEPVNGVNYLVSGGGGGHRDTTWAGNTVYAATNMGYVWLCAAQDALYLHFHDADGDVRYAHRLA
ncbi:MAG TPA: metallophosphoesterase [Candidatus Kapabacteria bacterium]|nr:metallophosphoesterase [Candidatus Kapabacteria bacterium]